MENKNYAILVSVAERSSDIDEAERSLAELERLLETADGNAFAKIIQIKEAFDPRTCIGSGKVREISELCQANGVELVVFDFELTPAQIRNLENDIGNDVSVIDRSMLILDIFALHAVSGEGKLQVELAQLKYSAPRLIGKGKELSRQGGGIGTRGPGESKLESDRRHLKEKISMLENRLREMESNRAVMRQQRDRSGIPKLALVGYTNAGKSTLLNYLTDAGVLCEDKLFATLDPTTRKMDLPSGESILITDTVGFIRKLPHHLVKAFKSTLDEVKYADVLLVVSDVTDSEVSEHIKVTEGIIEELGARDKDIIYLYNKCDKLELIPKNEDGTNVFISAKYGYGYDDLIAAITRAVSKGKKRVFLNIPYSEQSICSRIHDSYTVHNVDYTDTGVLLDVTIDGRGMGLYSKYVTKDD